MKAKLLKKIRKRFSWYININGFPVLVDHKNKEAYKIDETYFRKYFEQPLKGKIKWLEIDIRDACFRLLKSKILNPFGYDLKNVHYNMGKRLSERHKNFQNENK